ncbi:TPA: hypothetical protein ACIAEI_005352, partial [Escherichia coli]
PSYTKSVSWQHHRDFPVSFFAEKEIPLCKKVHRHLIYPVSVATHQVVGRGIIFLFMGKNLAFCASY